MIRLEAIDHPIRCSRCRSTIEVDLSVQPEVESVVRSLGPEVEHTWVLPVRCGSCGHSRSNIVVSAYEYPEGFLNWVDVESPEWVLIKDKFRFSSNPPDNDLHPCLKDFL